MADLTLLTISGALRQASTNRKLLAEAARVFGPAAVVVGDVDLPLYNGDMEDVGIPAKVAVLHGQIAAADAIVISTPEYNKALSGVLKNALDWVSRIKGPSPWAGKPVAILSAAAGRSGGERAQSSLRLCMNPFRPRLLAGPEVLLADSGRAFDAEGRLTEARMITVLTELMGELRAMAERGG
jgi:chromate reductase